MGRNARSDSVVLEEVGLLLPFLKRVFVYATTSDDDGVAVIIFAESELGGEEPRGDRPVGDDFSILTHPGQEFHLELARIKGQHVVLEFNDDLSQRVVGARAQVWHNRVSVNAVSKLLPEPGKRLLGLGDG